MAPWQTHLLEKVNVLHQEAFEQRTILTRVVQDLPQPKGMEAISFLARAMQIGSGLSEDEANHKARQFLQGGDSNFIGSKDTCPLMWRYDDKSLWRGMSDNKKLIRLIRSMMINGFLRDEPLRSRTFDLSAPEDNIFASKLLFGDRKIIKGVG